MYGKSSSTQKSPCVDREAMSKYPEKKKVHAASLEEVPVQPLMRKLPGETEVESEIASPKLFACGAEREDRGEIGSFP